MKIKKRLPVRKKRLPPVSDEELLPPLVALDLDGVCARFIDAMFAAHNERYGTKLKHDDLLTYEIEKTFDKKTSDRMYGIFQEPGFFAGLKPYPGARKAVKKLVALGFEIEVCTFPSYMRLQDGRRIINPGIAADKIGWVSRVLPEISGNITLTARKAILAADCLIDDSAKNIIAWCKKHPNGIGFLVSRVWNKNYTLPSNAVRAPLSKAPAILKRLLKKPVG